MSGQEQRIICRHCRENIPVAAGSCPNCGSSIRSTTRLVISAVIGAVLAVVSLLDIASLWLFGAIGLAVFAVSAYLLYDKRERQREAMRGEYEESSSALQPE